MGNSARKHGHAEQKSRILRQELLRRIVIQTRTKYYTVGCHRHDLGPTNPRSLMGSHGPSQLRLRSSQHPSSGNLLVLFSRELRIQKDSILMTSNTYVRDTEV